ncbi:MAG: radical SAM protein, partial [Bacteroidota bacterium]
EELVSEYLGVGYLTANLRRNGFSCSVFQWEIEEDQKFLEEFLPKATDLEMIGIPWLYLFSEKRVLSIARKIKKLRPDLKIVIGGHPPTFDYHRILASYECIDYVILGEGDYTLVELLKRYRDPKMLKELNGVAFRDYKNNIVVTPAPPQIRDLDELPDPCRDSLEQLISYHGSADNIVARMISSRGCYAQCEFCSMVGFYSIDGTRMAWRHRSPHRIVKEMELLVEKYHISTFWFCDDEFIGHVKAGKRRIMELAELLIKHNLPIEYGFDCRANGICTFSVDELRTLRKSGLRIVAMGLESGSQEALKRMNKSMNLKYNYRSIDLLKEAGIEYRFGFIMYDPECTLEDIAKNIEFLKFARPYKICNSGPFRLLNAEFPEIGTPLFNELGLERNEIGVSEVNNFPKLTEESLGYRFHNEDVSIFRKICHHLALDLFERIMVPRPGNQQKLKADTWYYGVNSLPHNARLMDIFLDAHEIVLSQVQAKVSFEEIIRNVSEKVLMAVQLDDGLDKKRVSNFLQAYY